MGHGWGHGGAGLDVVVAAREERHEEGGGGVEGVESVEDVGGVGGVGDGGPAAVVARVEGAVGAAEEVDQHGGAVGVAVGHVGAVGVAVGAWVGVGGGQVAGGAGGTADEVSVEDEGETVGVEDVGDEGCVGRGVAVEEEGHVGTEAGPGQEVRPVGGGVGAVAPVGGGEGDHEGGSGHLHSCLPLISFCSGSVAITKTHYTHDRLIIFTVIIRSFRTTASSAYLVSSFASSSEC